ncbi:uncharacterized protein LOC129235278 [Uloborus diversus]|uniref:uncharacterized protein LOC129235278 n=1 Tax=Uloborus diversus TaxID=327109 RepID=UPI00240A3734|nr:uncharacterized protein LOC129235278 [Uloborus diversus]
MDTANNATPKPKLNFNLDYFKTPAGQLRVAEGVISLAALISSVEGYCENDVGRYGFFLFIVIVSMLESICIICIFVLQLEKKIPLIHVPLTLLLNDCIIIIFYFINCMLAMLSIGRCQTDLIARVFAMLFSIVLFLILIGLNYTDYLWWQESVPANSKDKDNGTTVTESSPTVLT